MPALNSLRSSTEILNRETSLGFGRSLYPTTVAHKHVLDTNKIPSTALEETIAGLATIDIACGITNAKKIAVIKNGY